VRASTAKRARLSILVQCHWHYTKVEYTAGSSGRNFNAAIRDRQCALHRTFFHTRHLRITDRGSPETIAAAAIIFNP